MPASKKTKNVTGHPTTNGTNSNTNLANVIEILKKFGGLFLENSTTSARTNVKNVTEHHPTTKGKNATGYAMTRSGPNLTKVVDILQKFGGIF